MALLRLSEALPALLTLGVVNRDPSLAALDEDHKVNHRHGDNTNEQHSQYVQVALASRLESLTDRARQTCNDAGKDQHRNAIAHAAFGDLFAEPHHEHGACYQ